MLSSACQYSIRAMIYLATQNTDRYIPVREISAQVGVSHSFLAKVLGDLSSSGLLRSLRGPTGGVRLAKPSQEVKMADIVRAVDGKQVFDKCVLGLPDCGEALPCPLHKAWGRVRDEFRLMMEQTTLAEFANQTARQGLRLKADLSDFVLNINKSS